MPDDPFDQPLEPGFGPESIRIGGENAGEESGGAAREPGPEAGQAGPADAAADAWRALRDGLGATATVSAHGGEMQCVELCPICRAADILRATGPPELRGQISEFQREALVTMRALIDHYIERLDQPAPAEDTVEEIPIE